MFTARERRIATAAVIAGMLTGAGAGLTTSWVANLAHGLHAGVLGFAAALAVLELTASAMRRPRTRADRSHHQPARERDTTLALLEVDVLRDRLSRLSGRASTRVDIPGKAPHDRGRLSRVGLSCARPDTHPTSGGDRDG